MLHNDSPAVWKLAGYFPFSIVTPHLFLPFADCSIVPALSPSSRGPFTQKPHWHTHSVHPFPIVFWVSKHIFSLASLFIKSNARKDGSHFHERDVLNSLLTFPVVVFLWLYVQSIYVSHGIKLLTFICSGIVFFFTPFVIRLSEISAVQNPAEHYRATFWMNSWPLPQTTDNIWLQQERKD